MSGKADKYGHYLRYIPEEVWFPLSKVISDWDEDFHELMLADRIKMDAYEVAIKNAVKPGMAIADIGTGTGILAPLALTAGASVVYGIEVNKRILQIAIQRVERAGGIMLPEGVDAYLVPVACPKAHVLVSAKKY